MSFVQFNLGFCEFPVNTVYFFPVELLVFSFFFKMWVLFGLLAWHWKFAFDFVIDFTI